MIFREAFSFRGGVPAPVASGSLRAPKNAGSAASTSTARERWRGRRSTLSGLPSIRVSHDSLTAHRMPRIHFNGLSSVVGASSDKERAHTRSCGLILCVTGQQSRPPRRRPSLRSPGAPGVLSARIRFTSSRLATFLGRPPHPGRIVFRPRRLPGLPPAHRHSLRRHDPRRRAGGPATARASARCTLR